MWRALIVAVGLGLVAGCGGSGSGVATQLTIAAQTGSASAVLQPSQATLRCDGNAVATGFLLSAAGPACAFVRRGVIQQVAANQRSQRLCSQIYSGPQSAHITGTVQGHHIDLTVTRSDGCGTADWQTLEPLLGEPQRQGPLPAPGAATTVPTTTTAPPVMYQVKRGDTLTTIAKQFGVKVADIVAANQLADPDHLVEGQSLVIPPVLPVQLVITPPVAQPGTVFQFKLTGAKPAETVTFVFRSPDGTFTGPPHVASADGVVTATYQSSFGNATGIYTVVAQGNQGTTAQTTFRIDSATNSPTATSP